MKTWHCRINTTDDRRSEWVNMSVLLCEDDIPGSSLARQKPSRAIKTEELCFWLECRNDSAKGLRSKAQLVKRYALE